MDGLDKFEIRVAFGQVWRIRLQPKGGNDQSLPQSLEVAASALGGENVRDLNKLLRLDIAGLAQDHYRPLGESGHSEVAVGGVVPLFFALV